MRTEDQIREMLEKYAYLEGTGDAEEYDSGVLAGLRWVLDEAELEPPDYDDEDEYEDDFDDDDEEEAREPWHVAQTERAADVLNDVLGDAEVDAAFDDDSDDEEIIEDED